MTFDDAEAFYERLLVLAELFDAKFSEAKASLYFDALRDLPVAVVVSALNAAARSCTFMPRPAELRTLAVGDTEDAAESAWLSFRSAMRIGGSYASMAFDDAALAETIVAIYGGWPQACTAEFSPEMLASKRKEFGRVYRVMRGRALSGSRYLTGISEQQNCGRSDWMAYVPVKRVEVSGRVQNLELEEAEQARTRIASVAHGLSALNAAMQPGESA